MPPKRTLFDHPELGLPEVRKLWQTEGLFSDHYLKARIRDNAWWPSDAETQPAWEFCKALYEKRYIACAKNNEAFTRQELLDKILEKLGFGWTDNLAQPETKQDLEPDYILFATDAEKEAAIDQDAAHRYRAAVAILEAKKVNHPLSQISKSQQPLSASANPRLPQRSAGPHVGHPDERQRMAALLPRHQAEPLLRHQLRAGDTVA